MNPAAFFQIKEDGRSLVEDAYRPVVRYGTGEPCDRCWLETPRQWSTGHFAVENEAIRLAGGAGCVHGGAS